MVSTLTPVLTPTNTVHFDPFGTVSIEAEDIEFNVNGSGNNVDSIAFWEAPDPVLVLTQYVRHANRPFYVAKCLIAARAGHLSVMQSLES